LKTCHDPGSRTQWIVALQLQEVFSIVLLALVDANYKFIAVDAGAYGPCSDGGVSANSSLGATLREGSLQLPPDKPLPGTDEPMPHVILGDEAFPLKKIFDETLLESSIRRQ
jgi:hypothetical protein